MLKAHNIISVISFCEISLHRELFDRFEPEFAILSHLIDMAIVDILSSLDLDEQQNTVFEQGEVRIRCWILFTTWDPHE
ncbi:hypothetical protein C467_07917 [Halorubrum hochstenium ATCC 700873]|uniref:Uncharacterized protein n=1 Tax=Halorubrum hochstenium ATCC 700873 TaxID=1227481 RepID=M0FBQ7_9EURY|nr:hypothetical protein C467_07917 [Halorubrum hochstenium ATCC 700873]